MMVGNPATTKTKKSLKALFLIKPFSTAQVLPIQTLKIH